jgi:hypothetical protein
MPAPGRNSVKALPALAVQPFGRVVYRETPQYSRGAAAFVPGTPIVPTNPIGAGIYAPFRPRPYYAAPGTYEAGTMFWLSQSTPTTVRLQGLTDVQALAAVLGPTYVKAAVRTTG